MSLIEKIAVGRATLDDEEEALRDPQSAYMFALFIRGADIEKCQEAACKDPREAYYFALHVKGADVEKCREAACKDPEWAYRFALFVEGADIFKSLEACRGTEFENELNEHLMNMALV